MTFVIIGIAALFLWLFPALRCAVTHPFHCLYYAAKDGYKYIKYKQGNLRKTGNLDIFCGYFGNGKTLSLVKQVVCREYDTLQVVDNLQKSFDENDMLSEAEILANQAAPAPVGMDAVTPSRKGRRLQKDRTGKR